MGPGLLAVALVVVAGCGSSPAGDTAGATAPGEDTADVADRAGEQATVAAVGEAVWFGDHLSVGECWNDTVDAEGDYDYSGAPDVVDCGQPHDNEVIAVWQVDDDAHPGEAALDEKADTVCGDAFEPFVGLDHDTSALEGFAVWPNPADWEAGGRGAACSIYLPAAKVVGSLEGVGGQPRPHDYPDGSPVPPTAVLQRVGTTDEGDRLLAYDVALPPDEVVATIVAEADAVGWTPGNRGGASRTVVLEYSHAGAEYTLVVTAPDEAGESTSLAFYYPADDS